MAHTALILAGALALNLGVMAVAAQAQQQADPPPLHTSTPPVEGVLNWTRTAPNDPTSPGPASPGPMGAEVRVQDGPGGCIPRPGVPGNDGAANPCGPGGIRLQYDEGIQYSAIDRTNTVQACRARRGQVVMHQGRQQCRLPPPPPAAVGNPGLPRPGGILPR